MRQGAHDVGELRRFERLPHRVFGDSFVQTQEVVAYRRAEEIAALQRDAEEGAHRVCRQRSMGYAAVENRAAVDVPEAQEKARERRLARAALADDRRVLAASDAEGEVFEDGQSRLIGEADVSRFQEGGGAVGGGERRHWRLSCRHFFRCRCFRLHLVFRGQDILCRLSGGRGAEDGGGKGAVFGEGGLKDERPDGVFDAADLAGLRKRQEEQQQPNPEADARDVEQREQALALLALFRLFFLKGFGSVVEHLPSLGKCARLMKFGAPVDEIEERVAIGGAFLAQAFLLEQEGQGEVQQVKRRDEARCECGKRQERSRGEERDESCEKRRRHGAQVEVSQRLAARQKVVQEFALAHCALLERQLSCRLAVGQKLQLFITGEGEAVGEKAVEVAEDGAGYACGTHAGDAERQRREGRRECGARDDPRGGADERDTRECGEECREKCGQSFCRRSEAHEAQDFRHLAAPPMSMI